jgi:hypothetical protein
MQSVQNNYNAYSDDVPTCAGRCRGRFVIVQPNLAIRQPFIVVAKTSSVRFILDLF